MSGVKSFEIQGTLALEKGGSLFGAKVAYHTYGTLNKERNNVVWVCHALTANSDVFDWWEGVFGENEVFNPKEHFVVCANILGSHYGTSGPLSINPVTGSPFCAKFPDVTIRDMVGLHIQLANYLGIQNIEVLIGGSVGGQQALEWSIQESERINNLIVLATNAKHSAWGIAFNETQRMAIESDRTYFSEHPNGGQKGLSTARAIAMLSYRHHDTYVSTQTDGDDSTLESFRAASYQQYQGKKLANRFNAYSYHLLTKAMDSQNVGRGRGGVEQALGTIMAKTLCVGYNTDILFPCSEQQFLAKHIPNAAYEEIATNYGHDGFLVETEKLSQLIQSFLTQKKTSSRHLEEVN